MNGVPQVIIRRDPTAIRLVGDHPSSHSQEVWRAYGRSGRILAGKRRSERDHTLDENPSEAS